MWLDKIKKNINKYFNILLTLLFAMVCSIGFLQPIMADDYTYIGQIRMQGFIPFFKSFYLTWCGRIINSIFMGFCSISESSFLISGIFIGIGFIALVFLIVTCALGRFPKVYGEDRFLFILAFAMVWFGIPVLGECVFWRSGSGSYLWPTVLALLFIFPFVFWFKHRKKHNSTLYTILMLIAGFFAGSSQEQIFVALAVFCFLWFLYIRKNNLKKEVPLYLYLGIAALIIGGVVLIFAPGNFVRLQSAEHRSLLYKLAALAGYFVIYYFIVPVQQLSIWIAASLILIFLLSALENKGQKFCDFKNIQCCKEFKFWMSIALFSVLPMLFLAGSVSARTCFPFIVFLSIAFISMFDKYKGSIKIFCNSGIGMVVVLILLNILLVDASIGVANGYQLSKEVKSRDKVITENIQKGISDMEVAPFDILPFHTTYIYDVKIDSNHAVNHAVRDYYKINSIKLNHNLQKYEVEEASDVVDFIKNHFREKMK